MRFIVAVSWSIYPLDYFIGYVLGTVDDNILSLTYDVADMLNKFLFVAANCCVRMCLHCCVPTRVCVCVCVCGFLCSCMCTFLHDMFVGEGGQIAQDEELNEYVSAAFNTIRFIVTVGWSI